MKKWVSLILVLAGVNIFSLPVDWKGSFYSDYIGLDNYRRSDSCLGTSGTAGSQEILCVDGKKASFNSYIFRLNPEIILNDAVTIKGELSSGYARGGFFGDDSSSLLNQGAYYYNGPSGSDSLNVNQAYAEIHSEKGLIKVGRQARDWGLGLIYNDGDKPGERFLSTMDGIEFDFSFQKFHFKPFFGRINSGSLTTRHDDLNEKGISILYDAKGKDLQVGALYSKRQSNAGHSEGEIDLKMWDIFISKKWEQWTLSLEAPIISGTISGQSIKADSYIAEAEYRMNNRWHFNLKTGLASGDDPTTSENEGVMLHPNYNIAQVMFAFNQSNISVNDRVFDQGVSNAAFAHIGARYFTGSWVWKMALIYAQAVETYTNQEDDLGMEIDLGLEYLWYPGVRFALDIGYHMVGDYYAYTGGADLELKDPLLVKAGISIDF